MLHEGYQGQLPEAEEVDADELTSLRSEELLDEEEGGSRSRSRTLQAVWADSASRPVPLYPSLRSTAEALLQRTCVMRVMLGFGLVATILGVSRNQMTESLEEFGHSRAKSHVSRDGTETIAFEQESGGRMSSHFRSYPGTNCFHGSGGESIAPDFEGVASQSLEDCLHLCWTQAACEGAVVSADVNLLKCFLRTKLDTANCVQAAGAFNLWKRRPDITRETTIAPSTGSRETGIGEEKSDSDGTAIEECSCQCGWATPRACGGPGDDSCCYRQCCHKVQSSRAGLVDSTQSVRRGSCSKDGIFTTLLPEADRFRVDEKRALLGVKALHLQGLPVEIIDDTEIPDTLADLEDVEAFLRL
mmetsp:Transcript_8018/g.17327  ORF Transcript_8018/g.17327 Transcript_8018/m.17327 type:complete len:359 (-) Transcript_8018:105-1181(-)